MSQLNTPKHAVSNRSHTMAVPKHKTRCKSLNCSLYNSNRRSRRGFGTVEVVIILAVLITVAMLFRSTLNRYAYQMMDVVFKDSIIEDIDSFPD